MIDKGREKVTKERSRDISVSLRIMTGTKVHNISSWTLDLTFGKIHKHIDPPREGGQVGLDYISVQDNEFSMLMIGFHLPPSSLPPSRLYYIDILS